MASVAFADHVRVGSNWRTQGVPALSRVNAHRKAAVWVVAFVRVSVTFSAASSVWRLETALVK